jgi:hypothetical protein
VDNTTQQTQSAPRKARRMMSPEWIYALRQLLMRHQADGTIGTVTDTAIANEMIADGHDANSGTVNGYRRRWNFASPGRHWQRKQSAQLQLPTPTLAGAGKTTQLPDVRAAYELFREAVSKAGYTITSDAVVEAVVRRPVRLK